MLEVKPSHDSIPILDLSRYFDKDLEERKEFCAELIAAFKKYGFVSLINHGINDAIVDELFEWNQRFYALPLDVKMKAAHPPQPNPHRGYSYVGQEKLSMVKDYEKGNRDGKVVLDIKESFDQGSEDDTLYPNRWVDESDLPGFRSFMKSFYQKCNAVHLQLIHCIEDGLSLAPGTLSRRCLDNTSELRLNHYPACEAEEIRDGTANRISEHTDFGTLTLLFQDDVGGLEVEDQAQCGVYVPIVKRHRNEMIVNVGDCLQRWTNDVLLSASHRVRAPMGNTDKVLRDRYSVAYFAKPNRDQYVGTLDEFVTPRIPAKYGVMTAWEYNQAKLTLTY